MNCSAKRLLFGAAMLWFVFGQSGPRPGEFPELCRRTRLQHTQQPRSVWHGRHEDRPLHADQRSVDAGFHDLRDGLSRERANLRSRLLFNLAGRANYSASIRRRERRRISVR